MMRRLMEVELNEGCHGREGGEGRKSVEWYE